jgi:hypothetical protein
MQGIKQMAKPKTLEENLVAYDKWTNGVKVMGSGADKELSICAKCGGVYVYTDDNDLCPDCTFNPLAKQEGGNHYKDMAIQPVEFITANNLGFLEGNVVKYICRHHAKNGAEDIKKAIHYCELLLQTKYREE